MLVHGRRMAFCNNAAVHSSGDIWFTDSSTRYGIDRWKADLVENTGTGRLLRRDADGSLEVVLDGLRFANGVALSADESYVAVAETAARTVVRRWLTGPRAGAATGWSGSPSPPRPTRCWSGSCAGRDRCGGSPGGCPSGSSPG